MLGLEYAKQLDQKDPLASYKAEFYLPSDGIYLDGNSLGLLSKRAEQALLQSLEDWKKNGIDGWTEGAEPWFYFSEKLGKMSAPLIGAKEGEVVVTGSISVNLHQMLSTFYKPDGKRTKILADELAFPTDIYAVKSQLALKGMDTQENLKLIKSKDGHTLDEDDIITEMTSDVALILLPSVLYRSGQLLDMKKLTAAAHERGIIIGFDLAHSMGAVPHELHDWGVDFAVWCNYKYLNNGPGGVGGLFVHQKHFGKAPGLAGWFGSDKNKQFDMEHQFSPSEHAGAYQIGTPHVLSAAPLLGSLSLFEEVGIKAIREKSLALTQFLMELLEQEKLHEVFTMINPKENERRGGHVALQHEEAARICKALKENKIIPDFRSPNIIRLAPIAFYTSYEDVWKFVQTLKKIMDEKTYEKFENTRNVVA
ncbi:kynureninase [Bacillus carboniphilus]|uniref:Kynureninase n=1 Tax=Bacillus carboniphilus TaxID=86663 RepID=A0ABP3FZ43_9BACI